MDLIIPHKSYSFQFFGDAFDNHVDPARKETMSWDEWTEFFSVHQEGDKEGLAFIASEFLSPAEFAEPTSVKGVPIPGSVSRKKANVKNIQCLVLDYDGGATIAEVKEHLSGIRHLGYTSWSHLKDGTTQKFRIVIPLLTPCPNAEWTIRSKSLSEMFPGIDASTFAVARLFYTPRAPKERLHLAETWSANGEPLDWETLEKTKKFEYHHSPIVSEYDDVFKDAILKQLALCNFNDYQDWKALGGRLYNGGFSLHDYLDLSWTSAKKDATGIWSWLERQGAPSGIGPILHRIRQEFPHWSPPAQQVKLDFIKGTPKPQEPREEVAPDQRQFQQLTTPENRRAIVRDFVRNFNRNFAYHGVLRTPEGYGKSTEIVSELIRGGHDVLFCCLSHKQVLEKMEDFKLYSPVRVWSTSALVWERLGVKPVMHEQKANTWGDPGMDREATCKAVSAELGCSLEEAKWAVQELSEEAMESRLSRGRLLITTFATGDILFRMNYGKLDRVIVVDDPSMSDLMLFKYDFEGDEENAPALLPIAERSPEDVIFGTPFAFQDKVIWTTTEKLILEYLMKQHPDCHVVDVAENLDTGSNILMLPTHLVRKATKKVLPGITMTVEDHTHTNLLFISNGVRGELNLVNTKGRNDLSKDTVIVLSFPHPCDVAAVAATLGREDHERHEVMKQMVTDICDQAIGRSQGYRSRGSHVLVLIEPNLEVAVKSRSRYKLNSLEGLQRRGRLHGVPLTWHVHFPDWWAAHQAYLDTWHKFVFVFNGQVMETFSLKKLGLAKDEQQLLDRRLKEPAAHVDLMWKMTQEVIEGDEKRNFSEKMHVLVSKLNEKSASGKAGKRKYINPETGKSHMVDPANAPPTWVAAEGRQPKTQFKRKRK